MCSCVEEDIFETGDGKLGEYAYKILMCLVV